MPNGAGRHRVRCGHSAAVRQCDSDAVAELIGIRQRERGKVRLDRCEPAVRGGGTTAPAQWRADRRRSESGRRREPGRRRGCTRRNRGRWRRAPRRRHGHPARRAARRRRRRPHQALAALRRAARPPPWFVKPRLERGRAILEAIDDVFQARASPSHGIRRVGGARPQLVDPQRQQVGRVRGSGHEVGRAVGSRSRPPVGGPAPTVARRRGDVGQQVANLGERDGRIPVVRPSRADLRRHLANRRRQLGNQRARHRYSRRLPRWSASAYASATAAETG